MQTTFQSAFKGIDFAKAAEAIHQLESKFKADLAKAAEGFARFKAGLPDQLEILAMHGWFISGDHTPLKAIYPLAATFRAGRIEEGHQALCWHFNHELESIEKGLLQDFPNRATIIKKAFAAHRAGDFELSVPVLLAQADGIGRDTIAKTIPKFSIYSKQPKFQNSIESFIDEFVKNEFFTRDILKVAMLNMPLNVSEGDPMLAGDVLNRNEILHGTNTSYASLLNSCRAISWLEYISYFGSLRKLHESLKPA
jgi:hypothetical protein